MTGPAAYYLRYFGVTLRSDSTMQILFHEATLSLWEQPTRLGAIFKCPVGNGNIHNQSLSTFIQRKGLCVPHSQHGNVMLQCTPQEGSSLVFLSQWFVISHTGTCRGNHFPPFSLPTSITLKPLESQGKSGAKIENLLFHLRFCVNYSAGIYYITPFL